MQRTKGAFSEFNCGEIPLSLPIISKQSGYGAVTMKLKDLNFSQTNANTIPKSYSYIKQQSKNEASAVLYCIEAKKTKIHTKDSLCCYVGTVILRKEEKFVGRCNQENGYLR